MQSVERIFGILEVIASNSGGVGVSGIAEAVGLPKSTTSRILNALEARQVVTRASDHGFDIGPFLIRLASQQPFTYSLSALARPLLQRLAQETGEAAAICLPDGFQVYYLDHVQSRHAVQVRDWRGEHIPMHTSSAGKIFLAHSEPTLVEEFLKRPLISYTTQTITSPERWRAELSQIRQLGYAMTNEEFAEGVFGLAVPVKNSAGDVLAALNLYGPTFRFQPAARREQMLKSLRSQAEELANKIQS